MAIVKVDIKNLAATITADLKEVFPHIREKVQVAMQMHGPRIAMQQIARARPRPPVDRGPYRRGFKVEDTPTGSVMYNPVKYAGVIEKGRRRGKRMPPVQALEDWVKRKGFVQDSADIRSVAFAIARKIQREGWPSPPNQPMRIMEKTAAALEPIIDRAVHEAMQEFF